MTNEHNTVLYTGVTSNLIKRAYEHKNKLVNGFTKRYNISKLVYYEVCESAEGAIAREKKLKGSSRLKKVLLINGFNKDWADLYESL
jgi:putative endonuclease